jgi:hypothetical protein
LWQVFIKFPTIFYIFLWDGSEIGTQIGLLVPTLAANTQKTQILEQGTILMTKTPVTGPIMTITKVKDIRKSAISLGRGKKETPMEISHPQILGLSQHNRFGTIFTPLIHGL